MNSDKEQGTAETIKIITGLAALQQSVRDEFFARRLGEWSKDFLESYLHYRLALASPADVAQSRSAHLFTIAKLLDLLDEIAYLKIAKASPLSVCRFRLLRYKLELLRQPQSKPQPQPKEKPAEPVKPARPAVVIPDKKFSRNSEIILNYIKAVDRVRTKEVVEQFSALSERTVKRSLRELTELGLLKKTSEDRAMYYSARD